MASDSDFASKYTNANLAQNAAVYDSALFAGWIARLDSELQHYKPCLPYGVLVVMLCAQKRGDIAGTLFADAIKSEDDDRVQELFLVLGDAITMAAAFVGLPHTMPANFGLIAQLKQRNILQVATKPRTAFQDRDYQKIGDSTRKAIYRGVGNPEVSAMIRQYLPDLSTYSSNAIWGYTIGGCTTMELKEREVIIASSIIASGAARQARSHCKAALQLGNPPKLLQVLDDVAQELAHWNGTRLPEKLNVPQLAAELRAELEKLK